MEKKFLFLPVILIVFSIIVAGCAVNEDNGDEETHLTKYYGEWKSQSAAPYDDWFKLSSDPDTFSYYNNGDPTNDLAFKGSVVSYDLSGDITFLNIKITDKGSWNLTVNNFARVAIRYKTTTSCDESTGTLGIWPNSYNVLPTLEEAKSQFTLENGAFGYFGTYFKK